MKEDTLLAMPLSPSDMEVDLDLQVSEEEEKDLLDPEGVEEVKENHPPTAEVEVEFTPELPMLYLDQEASDREVGEDNRFVRPISPVKWKRNTKSKKKKQHSPSPTPPPCGQSGLPMRGSVCQCTGTL